MDNTKRFDGKGNVYAKSRPSYSEELLKLLEKELNPGEDKIFADIGSGTGKLTEQLLKKGYTVFAVEPNYDMRIIAEEKLAKYDKFISVDGTDKATGLDNESVDCITVAQAFHWFDRDLFKEECRRILKPGGKLILVYNSRDMKSEFVKELENMRKIFCKEFKGFSNGIGDDDCIAFFENKCTVYKWKNDIVYNSREAFISRLQSSSYSLKPDDEKYVEYMKASNELFDKYSENGKLIVSNYTTAYAGEIQ